MPECMACDPFIDSCFHYSLGQKFSHHRLMQMIPAQGAIQGMIT